jgi:glutamine synthetase
LLSQDSRRTRTSASSFSSPRSSRAFHKHAALLARHRDVRQRHRLGASEAPPAIISVSWASNSRTIETIAEGKVTNAPIGNDQARRRASPEIARDNTDQPHIAFAFTGNKFEFRAVGSSVDRVPDRAAQRGGRRNHR